MNRIYKVIWSKTRNCYVAVSEIAKNSSKNSVRSERRGLIKEASALALCLALSVGISNSAWAGATAGNGSYAGATGNIAFGDYVWINGAGHGAATWNDYGVAIGTGSLAESIYGISVGSFSHSVGDQSIAIGGGVANGVAGASANGAQSIAIGAGSSTHWADSIALGHSSTNYSWQSMAMGPNSNVGQNSNQAIAIGYNSSVTNAGSGIAFGNNANTQVGGSIAIGTNARITFIESSVNVEQQLPAGNSIAIGTDARAEAMDTTTIGRQSQALMRNATAYGNNSHANSNNSIAIGNKAIAGLYNHVFNDDGTLKEADADNSAVAIGNRATAINEYTTAIGVSSFASGSHSVSVGDSNRATGKFSTALGAGQSFYHIKYVDPRTGEEMYDEPGNPNSENDRNVYDKMEANQAAGDFSTAVGYVNRTVGENSTGVGMLNDVTGKDSLAVGSNNKVGTVKAEKGSEGDDALVEDEQDNLVTGYAVGSENEIVGEKEGVYDGAYGHKNKVSGDNSYAIGNENTVEETATEALAIGNKNTVSGEQSIAVGYGHTIEGKHSGAFGDPSYISEDGENAYAIGNSNRITAKNGFILGNESNVSAEGGIVAGSKSKVSAKDSVAIGNKTKATMKNSVALGSGSETTHMGGLDGKKEIEIPGTNTKYTNVKGESPVGTVSVGTPGKERTITNVAAGRIGPDSTDAVNGSELYAVEQQVVANTADIVNLNNRIDKVGAGAAALAGLHPLDFDPDEKWDFAASVGSYKSEQAVAIGAFYRPNEDTMFSIAGTIGDGRNMVNVGVSWKFGQKNRISANRISSAKEIIELRKNQENVHSFLADAVAGNQLDLSKIQLFPDVEENHWAYDYVATMAGNGVLEGYPDGYFKGNRNMTRYEMAAVLYRLMQNGARLSDRALTEFAPELDRIRVDTITKHKDGTPHIQRVRTIKERVEEKADPVQKEERIAREKAAKEQLAQEKAEEKAAKVKATEKPAEK